MLWLIYVSYLLLRGMVEESDRRAAFAAVFGIIGFVDVPIVFMSIRWWRTLHPQVVGTEGFNMEAAMLPALFLSVAAFTVVFLYLLLLRTGLERSQHEIAELRRRVRWLQEGGGV
jgi:heme exporter protein C